MTQEELKELSQEDQSLFMFISDNVNDAFVDEITKDELINLLFNNLKYKNYGK